MGWFEMRIMTFNIQHALDYKRQIIDIDFFVSAVKKHGADICCFNEVRGEGPIDGYTDQTNAIGDGLGFHRYFGEAIKVGGTSPYGNAITSIYPFKSAETILIPITLDRSEDSNYEPRCVIKAMADINGTEVCFLVCHMGLSNAERKNAVETLCKLIDEINSPVILTGDFNTFPQDKVLEPLFERLYDSDKKSATNNMSTYPSYDPQTKIDYIFYRGLKCTESKVITEIYSDHFPIVADFEVCD